MIRWVVDAPPDMHARLTRRLGRRVATGLIALATTATVWSQTPLFTDPQRVPGTGSDISRMRPPELPVPPPARFELRIETPEKSAIPRAVDELRFDLARVIVEGVTRYPQAEVDALFNGLTGRKVGLSEIREAAEQLERRYRSDGHFLVRVLIPAQRIVEGSIRIAVVEGRIGAAFAQSGSAWARQRVERVAEPLLSERPLALGSLESTILRINDLPGLSGQAVLRPGSELGTSDLLFTIADPPDPTISISVNNASSKPLGGYGLSVSGAYANPFGFPGSVDVAINLSPDAEKLKAISGRYAIAAGDWGGIFSLGALLANARPAGSLRALGIISDSRSITPRFRLPLVRSRGLSIFAEAGLAFNDSLTTLQDLEISHDRYAAGEWALIFSDAQRWAGSSQIRLAYSRGVPIGSLAPRGETPQSIAGTDPEFSKFTLSIQRNQSLGRAYSIGLNLRAQTSNGLLLSGERIAFGGSALGRGYDGGAIAGDRGWGALAELRWHAPDSLHKRWLAGSMTLFTFADHARTVELAASDPARDQKPSTLRSWGLGSRWTHPSNFQFELQVAKALIEIPTSDPRSNPRLLLTISKAL